ncbi:MAG: IS1634 family transposase [Deltaproteobacteria bacterium]|jgi:transposase|nr:IS1634 family transposase [Deltaproteobacteria bacterium]
MKPQEGLLILILLAQTASCLAVQNFITYFDSDNPSLLVKRGKSKEHRADLRIIGLSLMVSPDYNIPLFYEIYPGNTNDAKRFSETIHLLKARCNNLNLNPDITLVFDRGSNSASNFHELLKNDSFCISFCWRFKNNQCKQILDNCNIEYTPRQGSIFGDTKAFRTTKEEYGRTLTVVVTDNPELYRTQIRSIELNIEKCKTDFTELMAKLKNRNAGNTSRGVPYTVDSLNSKANSILSREYMKEIFDYNIYKEGNNIYISYTINEEKYNHLKNCLLGKTVLFTSRNNWTNEQIVSACRAQYHVESCFKQMKDEKYFSFTPIRHFTDNNIIVHGFYCVLALTLSSVLNIEFSRMGYSVSLDAMLSNLADCRQVINYYVKNKKIIKTYTLSKMSDMAKRYFDKYNIYKYSFDQKVNN